MFLFYLYYYFFTTKWNKNMNIFPLAVKWRPLQVPVLLLWFWTEGSGRSGLCRAEWSSFSCFYLQDVLQDDLCFVLHSLQLPPPDRLLLQLLLQPLHVAHSLLEVLMYFVDLLAETEPEQIFLKFGYETFRPANPEISSTPGLHLRACRLHGSLTEHLNVKKR